MLKIKLNELIINSTANLIASQNSANGSFPEGHNGPYIDPETSVRNTSHSLFLLAGLYQKTNTHEYKVAGEKAINYLFSEIARPYHKTFHCRDTAGKDHCNGLIGQAWVMEALIKAYHAFNREDCYELAEEIFLLHPWNPEIGIWNRVEIDGEVLTYDNTFNHQLWFASVAGQLDKTQVAQQRALFFLQKVACHVFLYDNGVIFHGSRMGSMSSYVSSGLLSYARQVKRYFLQWRTLKPLYSKSVGYHSFNLYAFAMLKDIFPEEPFWRSEKIRKMLGVINNPDFQKTLQESEFSYRYNVSGIEIAYAVETFMKNEQEVTIWLNRQLKETYLDNLYPLSRDAVDLNTSVVRIYEALRLINDYEVTIE